MNLLNVYKRHLFGLFTVSLGCLPLTLVVASSVEASNDRTISWAHYHFPPVYISNGDQRGEGIADQVIKLLQKEMHNYQHQSYNSSFSRIMRRFDDSGVVCSGMNKTAVRE